MLTVAVLSQKGGVGKTTVAVNLASQLAGPDANVLVVDLDPQGAATRWLSTRPTGAGLLDVFEQRADLADLVCPTSLAHVAAVPASPWLASADRRLAGEVGAELLLRQALGSQTTRWSWIVIDCPPSLGLLVVNALAAADLVLVPVEARVLSIASLPPVLATIDRVRERLNAQLRVGGIIVNRVDQRTRLARSVIERLRDRYPALTYQTVIRENVRLAEVPAHEQAIASYAPGSAGALDFAALTHEFLEREQKGLHA